MFTGNRQDKTNKLILLSGGVESTILAYLERPKYALTIDYGHIAAISEIKAAKAICKDLEIDLKIVKLDLSTIIHDSELFGNLSNLEENPEYVPFRNQFIITVGLQYAHAVGVDEIIIGTVKDDDIFFDGTPLFFEQLNLISHAQHKIKIATPAINTSALDLAKKSKIPIEILAWSHSCTRALHSCGECRSCRKRKTVLNFIRQTC
jgi:7-cyano-7-deazaguanine synthase